MTQKFDSEIHLAVFKYSNFCFFYCLHTLDSSGCRVKKDEHLEKKNVTWTLNNIFGFLNVSPFSPKGFFTFLVGVAHGVLLDF